MFIRMQALFLALALTGLATPSPAQDYTIGNRGYFGRTVHRQRGADSFVDRREERLSRRLRALRVEREDTSRRVDALRHQVEHARRSEVQLAGRELAERRQLDTILTDVAATDAAMAESRRRIEFLEARADRGIIRHVARPVRGDRRGRGDRFASRRVILAERVRLEGLIHEKRRLDAICAIAYERHRATANELARLRDRIASLDAECAELVSRCALIDEDIARTERELRHGRRGPRRVLRRLLGSF